MPDHVHATHFEIIKRLRHVEGHLHGMIATIEGGKPCLDVAQQLHAVEQAVAQAKRTLIHDHLDHCPGQLPREKRGPVDALKQIAKYL